MDTGVETADRTLERPDEGRQICRLARNMVGGKQNKQTGLLPASRRIALPRAVVRVVDTNAGAT